MPERVAGVRVFLATYSTLVRDRVAAMLAGRGMRIVGQAEAPQDCIDGILSTRPDVVVLGVQLHGGFGVQVLRAVRRIDRGIAFVIFSSHASPAVRLHYLAEGARCFVDKATEFDQLAGVIAHVASC